MTDYIHNVDDDIAAFGDTVSSDAEPELDHDQPGRAAILRSARGLALAKRYEISTAGPVSLAAYPKESRFFVRHRDLAGIRDLHGLLVEVETCPDACIIRGEPSVDADLSNSQPRRKVENGGIFADVPRAWALLDCDKIPAPASFNVLDDPTEAASALLDNLAAQVPELEDVSAVVRFSASAAIVDLAEAEAAAGLSPRWNNVVKLGTEPKVSAHVWIWLAVPQDGAAMKRWAESVNDRVGFKLLDPALFVTVQPHYTAPPVFGPGLYDPLAGRRTHFVEREYDAATLDIPAVAPRQKWQPGQSGQQSDAGPGYEAKLAAIGAPNGFHAQITTAAASFIATNWPNPDVERLISDIRARVLTADPGDRTRAEIDRYASDKYLREKVGWVLAQEMAKRAERARQAVEMPPLPPTYPDRGLSLDKAELQASTAVARFHQRVAQGECPHLLLQMTVGGGKTWASIYAIPGLLAAGRAVGRGSVLFLHPRHKLGDQSAANIRKAHPGLHVAIWRGMNALNPDKPGEAMCTESALPKAARKASQNATYLCDICPKRPECAYHIQAEAEDRAGRPVDVWVASHAVLTRTPFAGWLRITVDFHQEPVLPSIIIIDENPAPSWVSGLDINEPVTLKLSSLMSGPTENLSNKEIEQIKEFRVQATGALCSQPNGKIFKEGMDFFAVPSSEIVVFLRREIPASDEVSPGLEWAKLEYKTKPDATIPPGSTLEEALEILDEVSKKGYNGRRPKLGRFFSNFMKSKDARSVNVSMGDCPKKADQEPEKEIILTWKDDIFHKWQPAPILYLSATARPDVLRHWSPTLEVEEIEVAAPHQHVLQIADKEFGKTWAVQSGNISRLADCILVEVAKALGETLVILQKDAEIKLRSELQKKRGCVRDPIPEGGKEDDPAIYRFPSGAVLHVAHHGGIEGMNIWENVATLISVGRPATDRFVGERNAEVIKGSSVEISPAEDSAWPHVPAAIRMADGTGHRIENQHCHPDPLVEAWRWSVSEGAVMQAIGRARGVRRTADNPVRVVLMASMALPLTVEHVAAWDDYRPDPMKVAVAEAALFVRAMPLAAADMVKARPDLWTLDTAKLALKGQNKLEVDDMGGESALSDFERGESLIYPLLYKQFSPFNSQTRYRYRTGLRGRWSQCMAPIEGGRAAMEAIVGPVQAWEAMPVEVEDEPMTESAAEPPPVPVSILVPGATFTQRVSLQPGVVRSAIPMPAAEPVNMPASAQGLPWLVEEARKQEEAAELLRARHRPWQHEWIAAAQAARKTD